MLWSVKPNCHHDNKTRPKISWWVVKNVVAALQAEPNGRTARFATAANNSGRGEDFFEAREHRVRIEVQIGP